MGIALVYTCNVSDCDSEFFVDWSEEMSHTDTMSESIRDAGWEADDWWRLTCQKHVNED